MNRDHLQDDLIELGIASVDTKGSLMGVDDEKGGWKPHLGLSDD